MNFAYITSAVIRRLIKELVNWLTGRVALEPKVRACGPNAGSVARMTQEKCNDDSGEVGSSHTTAIRPVRIVRFLERDQEITCVGRMVISGRMKDVCAELDRLAATEAA